MRIVQEVHGLGEGPGLGCKHSFKDFCKNSIQHPSPSPGHHEELSILCKGLALGWGGSESLISHICPSMLVSSPYN